VARLHSSRTSQLGSAQLHVIHLTGAQRSGRHQAAEPLLPTQNPVDQLGDLYLLI